jgi:hypothetical protein
LLSLFQLWGEYLRVLTNFWCLMTVMLAILVGISHFAMGWSATTLAFVSPCPGISALFPQTLLTRKTPQTKAYHS